MTSIPSPFDAPRPILPNLGDPLLRPGGLLELLDGDDAHPRRHQGGPWQNGASDDVRQNALYALLRGEGAPPLPPADAARLADTLSHALRQDPSHPLSRELQQLPPDTLRQLTQFIAQHASGPRESNGLPAEPLPGPGVREAPDVRDARADARLPADTARVMSQSQAQQVAPDGGRHILPGANGRGEPLAMAGLAGAQEGRIPAEAGRQPTALMPQPDGVLSTPPPAQAPAPAVPLTQAAQLAQLQEQAALQQASQARTPGEATLPGRAEGSVGAADSGSSSGLPGMTGAGAAGVTLAAIAQPAGTTHAYAPQEALRARKPTANRKPARERVDEGPQDDTGDGHRAPRDERRRQDGSDARKDARQAAPAEADASTEARNKTTGNVVASGHTTATAPAPPRNEDDARREDRSWWITATDADEDSPETRHSRRLQWLYWSLVAVTYACLALALATVAPDLFRLPFAAEHMATWRNALTATGLATGLWAWLLARRMR